MGSVDSFICHFILPPPHTPTRSRARVHSTRHAHAKALVTSLSHTHTPTPATEATTLVLQARPRPGGQHWWSQQARSARGGSRACARSTSSRCEIRGVCALTGSTAQDHKHELPAIISAVHPPPPKRAVYTAAVGEVTSIICVYLLV